jgi:shikimate kinase
VRVKDSLKRLEVASTPGLQALAGDRGQLARHVSRIDPGRLAARVLLHQKVTVAGALDDLFTVGRFVV